MSFLKNSLAVLMLLPCLVGTGLAEERGHQQDREAGGRAGWHGEAGRIDEHDMQVWRGGRWHHGLHEGRYGWWRIVGSTWYSYPARIAPYPDPYRPPLVVVAASPAPSQYWYYCANPAGYYPYVAQCVVGWRRVPATVPSLALQR